jgi:hypothetical protein
MEKNLFTIIEAARKAKREVEFATGAEALQQIFGIHQGKRDSGA